MTSEPLSQYTEICRMPSKARLQSFMKHGLEQFVHARWFDPDKVVFISVPSHETL